MVRKNKSYPNPSLQRLYRRDAPQGLLAAGSPSDFPQMRYQVSRTTLTLDQPRRAQPPVRAKNRSRGKSQILFPQTLFRQFDTVVNSSKGSTLPSQ